VKRRSEQRWHCCAGPGGPARACWKGDREVRPPRFAIHSICQQEDPTATTKELIALWGIICFKVWYESQARLAFH